MILQLKTTLRLKDTPETQALGELFALTFPEGRADLVPSAGACRLEIDLNTTVTEHRKQLFLDLMRSLEVHLVETIYVHGQLGEEVLHGYLGPEKARKEASRSRLEQISAQLAHLLPEHRHALQAILATE